MLLQHSRRYLHKFPKREVLDFKASNGVQLIHSSIHGRRPRYGETGEYSDQCPPLGIGSYSISSAVLSHAFRKFDQKVRNLDLVARSEERMLGKKGN